MKESNVKLSYSSRIKNYVREKTGLMKDSDIAKLSDKKLIELLTHSSPGSDREKIVLQAIESKLKEAQQAGGPPPYLDQTQTYKGTKQTYTLMTAAAKYGHTDVVNLLAANGVDPATSMRTNSKGLTGSAQEYQEINKKNGGPPRRQYYNSEKAAIAFIGTAAVGGAGAAVFFTGGAAAIPIFFATTTPSLATTGFGWTAGAAMVGYAGAAGLYGTAIAGAAGLYGTAMVGAAGVYGTAMAGAAGVVTTIGTALGIAGTAVGTTGMGATAGKIVVDVAVGTGAAMGLTSFAAGTYALMKKDRNKSNQSPQANQNQAIPDQSIKLTPKYNKGTGITTYADTKGKPFLESKPGLDGKATFNPQIAPGMKVVIPSPRMENGKPIAPPQYDVIELDHTGKLLATRMIPPLALGEKPRGQSSIDQKWLSTKLADSDLPGSTKNPLPGTVVYASDHGKTTIPRGVVTSVSNPNKTPDNNYEFKAEDFSVSLNSDKMTVGKYVDGKPIYEASDVVKIKPMKAREGDGIKFVVLPSNSMKPDDKIEIKHARMDGDHPCVPPQFDVIELDSKGKLIGSRIDPPLAEGEKERGTSAISQKWLENLDLSDMPGSIKNPVENQVTNQKPLEAPPISELKSLAPAAEISIRFGDKESKLNITEDGSHKSNSFFNTAVKTETLNDGVKFTITPSSNLLSTDIIEIKQARMDGNNPCNPPQFDLIELDSKGNLRGAKIISAEGKVEEARGTSAISKEWLDDLKASSTHLSVVKENSADAKAANASQPTNEDRKQAHLAKMAAFRANASVEHGDTVTVAPGKPQAKSTSVSID